MNTREASMRRYLVVANQTLGGEALLDEIRGCLAVGTASFHVVVPATAPHEQISWTEGAALAVARERLVRAVSALQAEGIPASGEVGDANPVLAIEDAIRHRPPFDAIILSTLPAGLSRWIHLDVPHRVARRTGLPVRHIVAELDVPERVATRA
jgi:GABA permease